MRDDRLHLGATGWEGGWKAKGYGAPVPSVQGSFFLASWPASERSLLPGGSLSTHSGCCGLREACSAVLTNCLQGGCGVPLDPAILSLPYPAEGEGGCSPTVGVTSPPGMAHTGQGHRFSHGRGGHLGVFSSLITPLRGPGPTLGSLEFIRGSCHLGFMTSHGVTASSVGFQLWPVRSGDLRRSEENSEHSKW